MTTRYGILRYDQRKGTVLGRSAPSLTNGL